MKIVLSAAAVNAALVVGHLYFGLAYLLGSDRASSTSLTVAFAWLPSTTWGASILAGAALTVAAPWMPGWRSCALLHLLAAAPLTGFAVALVVAEALGVNAGWGGPALFGMPAVGHVLLARERRRVERWSGPT